MKKSKKFLSLYKRIFIIGIVILAFFIRIYHVPSIPPSLSWDEVSIGYNAYSILKTGYDEHGDFLPLDAFTAYGDYKPPLAIYLTVPSVAFFGLTEFAVRLPSIAFGTFTILAVYLLIKELLFKNKYAEAVAIITSLLMTISPWHIQLSRAGFEGNIAVFFIIFGVYLILKSRSIPWLWYVMWLPFVAATYTFNSARYFAPLLSIGLAAYLWSEIKVNKQKFTIGIIIALFFCIPIIPHLLSKESRLRFHEVNIFSDLSVVTDANRRIQNNHNSWWAKIIYNRRIGYFQNFILHYLDNFKPSFLFIQGDGNPKFSTQATGQLFFFELPLLVAGCFLLIRQNKRTGLLALYWLAISIIPAATARETPHALRIENSLPIWQLWCAYAIVNLLSKQKKTILFNFLIIMFIFLYLGSYSYFHHNYFNHYAYEYSGEWQYGYREAIKYASQIENQYDEVVLTESIGRPYMYLAFYKKMDPNIFRQTIRGSFDTAGFYNVWGLGKYRFVRGGYEETDKKVLWILDMKYVPEKRNTIDTIRLLNGDARLEIFEIN